jgi:hypothetical protein
MGKVKQRRKHFGCEEREVTTLNWVVRQGLIEKVALE